MSIIKKLWISNNKIIDNISKNHVKKSEKIFKLEKLFKS